MTPEPQPINVGLIGFGFAGRTFHAPVIRAVKRPAACRHSAAEGN